MDFSFAQKILSVNNYEELNNDDDIVDLLQDINDLDDFMILFDVEPLRVLLNIYNYYVSLFIIATIDHSFRSSKFMRSLYKVIKHLLSALV